MFKTVLVALGLTGTILAATGCGGTPLDDGLPSACYDTGVGCQYGPISQRATVHSSGIQKDNSDLVTPGTKLFFSWDPAPCYPKNKYAITIQPNGYNSPIPTSILNVNGGFVGELLSNLGGTNKTFTEYVTLSGEGLRNGLQYQVTLQTYNQTTGAPGEWAGFIYFTWQS